MRRPLNGFPLFSGLSVPRRRRLRPAFHAAGCERLEDRTLLTAFVVNSLADGPATADGQLTLREALTAANTNAAVGDAAAGQVDGDTITFAAGLAGTIALNRYELLIADDVRVDGHGRITIDAGGRSGVLFVETAGATGDVDVTLAGLTLTGGKVGGSIRWPEPEIVELGAAALPLPSPVGLIIVIDGPPANGRGGGIEITAGETVTLRGVIVSGNESHGSGGGIYNAGTLVIDGSSAVMGNRASQSGGGICNVGGTLRLFNSRVVDNFASGFGGGVHTSIGYTFNGTLLEADVVVHRSEIGRNGTGANGGGIAVYGGRLLLDQSTLNDNTALSSDVYGYGGGLHLSNDGTTATIHRSVVRGNQARAAGGGVSNEAGRRLTIDRSVVTGNVATGAGFGYGDGGGVFNDRSDLLVFGSLIGGNTAAGLIRRGVFVGGGAGGGILSTAGAVRVDSTSVEGNAAAGHGGGIFVLGGVLVLDRCLLGGNSAGTGPNAAGNPGVHGDGGGLYAEDFGTTETSVTVHRTDVRNNVASRRGGGLWNPAGVTMTVDHSYVRDNRADGTGVEDGGGGIFNDGGRILVAASVVAANGAAGATGGALKRTPASGSGGGIFSAGGEALVYVSTVENNLAFRAGGGVRVAGGRFVADRSVLADNDTGPSGFAALGYGGGLHASGAATHVHLHLAEVRNNSAARQGGGLWSGAQSTTFIDRSVIYGNTAREDGGGVFGIGSLDLTGCTVAGNGSDRGGGMFFGGSSARIVMSAVSQNEARSGAGIFNAGRLGLSATDVLLNDASGGGGGVFTHAGAVTDVDALERVFANVSDDFAGPGAVV